MNGASIVAPALGDGGDPARLDLYLRALPEANPSKGPWAARARLLTLRHRPLPDGDCARCADAWPCGPVQRVASTVRFVWQDMADG